MKICSHCLQDIPEENHWNGLSVTALGDIYWRGIRQPKAQPLLAKVLFVLTRRGEASHGALEMIGSEHFHGDNLKTSICHLRRWLEARAIGVRIVPDRGFGYHLELAPSENR